MEGDLREKAASSCRVHTSQNTGHTSGYSALWVQAWTCLCFTHQSPWGGGQHLGPGCGACTKSSWLETVALSTPVHAQSPRPHLGTSDFAKGTDSMTAPLAPLPTIMPGPAEAGLWDFGYFPGPQAWPPASHRRIRLRAQGKMPQDEAFGAGGAVPHLLRAWGEGSSVGPY